MKNRKYDATHMTHAVIAASDSKCKRNQVGAVIVKDNRIISTGYNGTPEGYKYNILCENCKGKGCTQCNNLGFIKSDVNAYGNDCGEEIHYVCPKCESINIKHNGEFFRCFDCSNKFNEPNESLKTDHSIVLHAEANAILFAGRYGQSCVGATLFVTLSPCTECSKLILQAGIKRVVYLNEYRNTDGLAVLKSVGVSVSQFKGELKIKDPIVTIDSELEKLNQKNIELNKRFKILDETGGDFTDFNNDSSKVEGAFEVLMKVKEHLLLSNK